VDDRGHSAGFRSDRYREAVTKVDSLIGVLINTLKETGIYDETVVFVVSDHGGYEKSHGGSHPDEMIVPFIISGKWVKKGYKINHPVFNYDLAPTVAWLLGFQLNEWVSGKPLKDAFIRGH
jgi:arylsulfatase A-like enzyme